MYVKSWSDCKGFSLTIDFPNRHFVLSPNSDSISITTSYNELLELQNLISERLVEFKKLQEKESEKK